MDRKRINIHNGFQVDGKTPVSWEVEDDGTDGVTLTLHGRTNVSVSLHPTDAEELALNLLQAAAANRITYRYEREQNEPDPDRNPD